MRRRVEALMLSIKVSLWRKTPRISLWGCLCFFWGGGLFFYFRILASACMIPFFRWECFLPRFLMTFARKTHWFQDRNNKTQEEPGAQVNRLQVMCWLITKTTSIPLISYDTSWTMSSNNRCQMLATEKCWNAVNSKLVQSTACRVKIPAPARIGCVRPGDVSWDQPWSQMPHL